MKGGKTKNQRKNLRLTKNLKITKRYRRRFIKGQKDIIYIVYKHAVEDEADQETCDTLRNNRLQIYIMPKLN